MSNAGQAILTVVGTVVGAYFGQPQLGFVLGSLAGNALFPTQLQGQTGPRLNDLATTSSVIGSPVPIVFGTTAVPGCVMWLGALVEITNKDTVGGKGGPEQTNTTFSYTQSVAVGLAEGPISGVSRIWENGELVYDVRPQLPDESDVDFANRGTASAAYAETFTLYLGDEDQEADPTIELDKGAGNVPAFRGLAYLVYADRALLDKQGLRHPNFKFEVFAGTFSCETLTDYANDVLQPWNVFGDPYTFGNRYTFSVASDGARNPDPSPMTSGDFPSLAAVLGAIDANRGKPMSAHYLGYTINQAFGNVGNTFEMGGFGVHDYDTVALRRHYNSHDPTFGTRASVAKDASDINDVTLGDTIHSNNAFTGSGTFSNSQAGVYEAVLDNSGHPPSDLTYDLGFVGSTHGWWLAFDAEVLVTRQLEPPRNPCLGLAEQRPGFCVIGGYLVESSDFVRDDSTTYHVLQQLHSQNLSTPDGGTVATVTKYPLGPARPLSHPQYGDSAFWTAAYNDAVTAGAMAAGLTFGVDYPVVQSHGYVRTYQRCTASAALISLADIVTGLCERSGMTADLIDVTDLADRTVNGYAIGSVMAARAAITPLQQVGFFDVVESGGVLKFPTRGKDAVATLGEDDFGAYDGDSTSEPPPAITTVKAQDVDLPRQLRVHYSAPSRDYEAGEQLSPTRLTTAAVNDVDIEIAVSIPDDQAAQIAEVLWSDAWASRYSHELSVDAAFTRLEPADAILVPVDGRLQRMRIVASDDADMVLRKLSLVRDASENYVSAAVAAKPDRPTQSLSISSPTALILLDLPALRDSDGDAGIYAAGYPSSPSRWPGCVVFRSVDGGASFSPVGSLTTAATVGTLDAGLPGGSTTTFDSSHALNVTLVSGSVESRTEAAVLAGANAAAIGGPGRWEIIQFCGAEQTAPGKWRLTELLRGRRGTEFLNGVSAAGDQFVLLTDGAVGRLPLEVSQIGQDLEYKAVTIGASYTTGVDEDFTGAAVALRCYSPVDVQAEQDTGGDWLISWTRRARIAQELVSGITLPINETTEAYSVDVLAADGTVVRTLPALAGPSIVYSAADQLTDFGTGLATSLILNVYQLSATIGRGTPGLFPVTRDDVGAGGDADSPTGSPDRSESLSYLSFVKALYPAGNARLDWRFRYTGFVVDIQNSAPLLVSQVRRYDDGNNLSTWGFGAFDVVCAVRDPDNHHLFLGQLNLGLGASAAGAPGIIRKVDADTGAYGPQVFMGAAGEPTSLVIIGTKLYAACPAESVIRVFNVSDLSTVAVLSCSALPYGLATNGVDLWNVAPGTPTSPATRIDKATGATLQSFPVAQRVADCAIIGGSLYVCNPVEPLLYRYSLATGALLETYPTAGVAGHGVGGVQNSVFADGLKLSVGHGIVYVLDTQTDTITP